MLSEGSGCENSSVLHHGSLIRIGCLQFVFSVVVEDEGRIERVKEEATDRVQGKEENLQEIKEKEEAAVSPPPAESEKEVECSA